jgi:methyltransferase (TIGR00027 family)
MREKSPSTTALVTARMRSIHTLADPKPLLNDTWGEKFSPASDLVSLGYVGESVSTNAPITEESVDELLRGSPAYANVIVRSWYTEAALHTAILEGMGQYVIIGAGFDSYACRRTAETQDLKIFEIDHPSTQGLKKKRLAECGVPVDENLHFISADLGQESLESALSRSTFSPKEPAFLSWLGVTMYLSREVNKSTLESIARYCAPGSQLVFSYVDQVIFEAGPAGDAEDIATLKQRVKSVGEPFVSGFHPDSLESELKGIGLRLEEDLDDLQILERCDAADTNGLRSSSISRIASVRVIGQ